MGYCRTRLYKSITGSYYKGAKGAFVVFDLSKKEKFLSIDMDIVELKLNTVDLTIIVIGNKSDLENTRTISREEAEAKCQHYSVAYIETSALKSINIDNAFINMLDGINNLFRNL